MVGSWLVMLALEDVVLLDLLLSEGLDSGGMALLGLAQLLVVLLLSGDGFPAGNVVAFIVRSLLLSQGMESLWHGVVRHGVVAALVEALGMSLPTGASVSHVVGGVSSPSHMGHLLWVTVCGVLPHGVRSASLVLLTIVRGSEVTGVVSLWMGSHLTMVRECTSPHLTVVAWLLHLSVVDCFTHLALVMSHSVHSVQALLVSGVRCYHSALHLLSPLSFHGFLLSFHVLLLLFFALVEHVANFAKMVNLAVSSVKFIVFVSTLNHRISLLLLGHLGLLGLRSLLLSLLVLGSWSLGGSLGLLLAVFLLTLLLRSWLCLVGSCSSWWCLGELLLGLSGCATVDFSQDIDDDV